MTAAIRGIASAAIAFCFLFIEIFVTVLAFEDSPPSAGVIVMSWIYLTVATVIYGFRSLGRSGAFWLLIAFQFALMVCDVLLALFFETGTAGEVGSGLIVLVLLAASVIIYLRRPDDSIAAAP